MRTNRKILVLCKESACEGGVVNYIDSVMKHYRSDSFLLERFTIGRRAASNSNLYYLLVLIYDYVRLFVKLFSKEYKLIHLNPSLGEVAVMRDCIFIIISKLHCIKVLVFWHGWNKDFEEKIETSSAMLWLFKLIYGSANLSIVLASSFKNKLIEWNFKNKIIVDTTTFDDSLTAGFELNQKVNEIKFSTKLTILFLSRLEASKGVLEALEAFLILKNCDHDLEFVIAGDGPAFNLVKELVDQSGDKRISMLGYVRGEAKKAILERSHLMLFPTSYGEGLPVCIIEAMAFGIPVITTAVGGIPDNFIEGENGYFVHNVTGRSLAEKLRKILPKKNDLARIAANNFSVAAKKYPSSVVAKRLDAIYQQVVNSRE